MYHRDNIIYLLAIALPVCVVLFFLLKLVSHSRRVKIQVTADSMIGCVGQAKSPIAENGMVLVRGELWHAYSLEPIAQGTKVRVIGYHNLALTVQPCKKGN